MNNRKNLLIIGAGAAGKMVLNDFKKTQGFKYNIVGFIDDKASKLNTSLGGVKVLGNRHDIIEICKLKNVHEILLAIPSLSAEGKAEILNICNNTSCEIKILPSMSEIMNIGNLKLSVRNMELEDLLARDPVVLDNVKIAGYISGKTVMITGGGGSIGSELCRQVARFNPEKIVVFDIYENNAYDLQNEFLSAFPNTDLEVVIGSVRDKERLNMVFSKYRPHVVFHAAAHKHVPLMEKNPSEAVINNVLGTLNTANCAKKYNADKFILISSDKAVNPTNVMGATKRLCEMIIQSIGKDSKTEFVAVRFGNVLGSNGSVVPLFKNQIKNGGPITLTHKDVTRFFMTITEAAQLVLEATSYAGQGEIYVLDMGKPIKIYDLAIKLIKLSGLEPFKDINIVITGLRSGEKLYEEMLMDQEDLSEISNSKIFVAKPMNINWSSFEKGLIKLFNVASTGDGVKIRRILSELVETYTYIIEDKSEYEISFENECININDIKRRAIAEMS
ncbi:MAG: UDP-N-acetyl-alpha-D-glucosamine C6 dehydratase [Firmicutes bacterium ADurb.Bin193]|nr:MAG: UDP-N-acetyl-alpha-D-glucosamine C6 dehydratase [Firmicutes bacterium ADurb.Bin193]